MLPHGLNPALLSWLQPLCLCFGVHMPGSTIIPLGTVHTGLMLGHVIRFWSLLT